MIYTSYFAALRRLPENIVPISIAGWPPSGWTGLQYKVLAPKYWFFEEWKERRLELGDTYYVDNYREHVLKGLDPEVVANTLYSLAGTTDICLVCYEKSGDFCHRHLVSEWLRESGIDCKEYGHEQD